MKLPKYLDPQRYQSWLRRRSALAQYNLQEEMVQREKMFASLDLDMEAGRAQLDVALKAIGSAPFDDEQGTDSVHWLLFASLSVSPPGSTVKRILEIGTFRAKTTLLLKTLFPWAQVVTCDLPDDDPILTSSYRRDTPEALAEYQSVRDGRVAQAGISFVQANSFFLPSHTTGPFDLIWMDAGHEYPEVAWDFCNSWHMCSPGGVILCDDIIPNPKGAGAYAADESHKVIDYVVARTQARRFDFLKRLNPVWSADPVTRKFVAWVEKP